MKFTYLIVLLMILTACSAQKSSPQQYYLLVGTYTREKSEGIYVYKFNEATGRLRYVSKAAGVKNPSYLAVAPDKKHVYAVNELDDGKTGNVSAFLFNNKTGKLKFINKQSSQGVAPCYVAVDATGQNVFAANYSSGSFSQFGVQQNGGLTPAQTTITHHGSSVNPDRQSKPHVHCTHLTPDNKFLLVNDLGTDQVTQYAFNASAGVLDSNAVDTLKMDPGTGPRHITFTSNEKYAYVVTEMGGQIYGFTYDEERLHPIQTISGVPDDFKGKISGAEVRISPDGKFLYVSFREDLNDIAIFSIDEQTGRLTQTGRHSSGGKHPRNIMIDPSGKYLLAANQNSDNIVVFKRNKSTGELTPTGTKTEVSMPVCLKMIPVD